MKKFAIYFTIFSLILSQLFAVALGKSKKADIKSTEGLEISQTEAKNVSNAKSPEDKERKQQIKSRKKIIKNLSKIKGYENKKRLKERDKDFFENRLNIKKQKLEKLQINIEATGNKEFVNTNDANSSKNEEKKIDIDDKKGEN